MFSSDFFILAAGKALQMLVMLFAVRLYTGILSPTEVGSFVLITTTSSIVSLVFISPIGNFINRNLHKWKSTGLLSNALSIYLLYIFLISCFSFFTPFFLKLFNVGLNIDSTYFGAVLIFFVLSITINQTVIPFLNMFFYRKEFVFFSLISQVLYVALSAFLTKFFNQSGLFWVIGQTIGLLVSSVPAWLFLKSKIDLKLKKPNSKNIDFSLKDVFEFSFPLLIISLMMWVLSNSYRYIIEAKLGSDKLAYISIGIVIAASIAGAVETLFMQTYQTKFYSALSIANNISDRSLILEQFINNTVPGILIIMAFLIISSPYLSTFLFSGRFSQLWLPLAIGFFIETFRILTNIVAHAAHSEYATKSNVKPYAIGAVIVLFLTFLSIKLDNLEILVPLSILVAWFFVFLYTYFVSKKLIRFSFPWKVILLVGLAYLLLIFVDQRLIIYKNNQLYSLVIMAFFGAVSLFLFVLQNVYFSKNRLA